MKKLVPILFALLISAACSSQKYGNSNETYSKEGEISSYFEFSESMYSKLQEASVSASMSEPKLESI